MTFVQDMLIGPMTKHPNMLLMFLVNNDDNMELLVEVNAMDIISVYLTRVVYEYGNWIILFLAQHDTKPDILVGV